MPAQYGLAAIFLALSLVLEAWMPASSEPLPSSHVLVLTAAFGVAGVLAATQDVAVDGWALTLLSRRNVGTIQYATCSCCCSLSK